MMKLAALLCLFSCCINAIQYGISTNSDDILPHHDKCKPITVPFCIGIPYNTTIMPNLLGHSSQEEAGMDVHQYFPLVKINCSPNLQLFLCSVYVPVCTILEEPVPPCRSLCISAKTGCEGIMKDFGFSWPETLNCSKYPADNSPLCVGQNVSASPTTATIEYNQKKPPKQKLYSGGYHGRDIGFVCPLQFQVKSLDYTLKVGKKVEKNCGAPCELMFFKPEKREFAHVWIGTWSILCSISCLFTVATFLIDTDRFRYPERPIIFLSVCYLMVALAYVVGFAAGDDIACSKPATAEDGIARVKTITQGTKYELCTILFMVLYFFSMASSIWWVVLTLTWFLAAGLKWGHEAIEANSQYFHLAAWAIPSIKTITVLAMGKVDGDILSGVCYVGLWNVDAMRIFVLIPLCAYLIFGTIFLVSGFISLFRIRTVMKHDGTKTDKLEKLMIRIGVFSVLYTLPAIIVISCLLYEHIHFDDWMLTWSQDMCLKQNYSVPCPKEIRNYSRPLFEVFMIKYLMYMIVGITSSVWIWSGKTVQSWKMFFNKVKGRQVEAYV